MRRWLAAASLLAPRLASACPACASTPAGPRPVYLILVVLPLVVGALAARAILRAMRD